jgi:hypothetical protein
LTLIEKLQQITLLKYEQCPDLNRSGFFMLCISLVYIAVAVNSNGFNNADEHFQIIEFAQFKLGNSDPSALAWEFHSQVRPGLQPFMCFSIFKFLKFLGINDPYTLSFALRLVTAMQRLIKAAFPRLPVLAISCNADIGELYRKYGFDDYIPKSFEIKELILTLRRNFGGRPDKSESIDPVPPKTIKSYHNSIQ